jgi:hypothetical protein
MHEKKVRCNLRVKAMMLRYFKIGEVLDVHNSYSA